MDLFRFKRDEGRRGKNSLTAVVSLQPFVTSFVATKCYTFVRTHGYWKSHIGRGRKKSTFLNEKKSRMGRRKKYVFLYTKK